MSNAPVCDQAYLVDVRQLVKRTWEPAPLALHIEHYKVEGQAAVGGGSEFPTSALTSDSEISDSASH